MNTNYNFCTVTGKEYVVKIIALQHSLQKHARNFKLWVCCIDYDSYHLLIKMNLKNVVVIGLHDFPDGDVYQIRNERSDTEFCWTLKSIFTEYLLTQREIDSVLYCDGDIYFFSDPKAIFNDWGDSSVYLCPQRDYDWVEKIYGKYQAGIIGFKKDKHGLESLKWWKERCLEWCHPYPYEGKFSDQKYLETLAQFPNIKVSNHIGVNAAPWNCFYGDNHFHIHVKDNQVYLNEFKLVAYHFSSIAMHSEHDFDLWTHWSHRSIKEVILNHIYVPYLKKIREIRNEVKEIDWTVWNATLTPYKEGEQIKNYFYLP